MKKYFVLTSVLALAACGGGSGGGGAGGVVVPSAPGIVDDVSDEFVVAGTAGTLSQTVADSNAVVTGMVSEIGVAQDGSTINIISARHGASKHFTHKGKEYVSHKIDEAHFYGSDEYNPNEYITFGIDETTGEIDKVVQHSADMKTYLDRKDKTNIFKSNVYKYVIDMSGTVYQDFWSDSYDEKPQTKAELIADIEDSISDSDHRSAVLAKLDALGDDWDSDENWNQETHWTKYDLRGKYLATKLRYSDFGYITYVDEEGNEEEDYSVIAGGYDKIKGIDLSEKKFADKEFSFTGTAIAAAAYETEKDWNISTFSTDEGAATLKFKDGKEVLYMPFKDYYAVTVTKDGDVASIDFAGLPQDANFQFAKESGISTETDRAYVNIRYYGDRGNPSETTGTVYYEEEDNTGMRKEFQGAFGMTRDNK